MSTLLPHLQRKLLKKLNSFYQPKSLREAMDVTMDIEVGHQITQPEQQLTIMETCCKEPPMEETYTTEEVQMRSQAQKQGQQQLQGSYSQLLRNQNSGQKFSRKSKLQQIKLWIRLQVSIQQGKWPKVWQQTFVSGTTPTCFKSNYYAAA